MDLFYEKDLARIHDRYFSDLAENAACEMLRILPPSQYGRQIVVDLGCGSGTLSATLASHGMKVTGVDISAHMLEIARSKSADSNFVECSIFEYEIIPCTLVTSIGEPFNYVLNADDHRGLVKSLLCKVFDALKKGGILIFDILTSEISTDSTTKIFAVDDLSMRVEVNVDIGRRLLERKISLAGEREILWTEIHRQYLFEKEEVEDWLTEIGFQVLQIDRYDQLHFREGHVGFICTKGNV